MKSRRLVWFLLYSFLLVNGCNKEEVKVPSCRITHYTSQNGLKGDFSYNSKGQLTSIDYTYSSTEITATIEYNSVDQITKVTSGDLNYSTYAYPSSTSILETLYSRTKVSDPFAESTITHLLNPDGSVNKQVYSGSAGTYLRYEYDARGNQIKVYAFNGTAEYLFQEFSAYDEKVYGFTGVNFNANVYADITPTGTTYRIVTVYTPQNVTKKNNYTLYKQYAQNGSVTNEIQYAHMYNDLGYPTIRFAIFSSEHMEYECN